MIFTILVDFVPIISSSPKVKRKQSRKTIKLKNKLLYFMKYNKTSESPINGGVSEVFRVTNCQRQNFYSLLILYYHFITLILSTQCTVISLTVSPSSIFGEVQFIYFGFFSSKISIITSVVSVPRFSGSIDTVVSFFSSNSRK